ncbi:LysR family transcriptional regulator [Agaribacterium sp. ZY112]|uniref:LysR family transcriptional regulator n=1 Tax=Agaribacterium sp. ZY112 TaxID=3233574 RepID=UPI003524608B
MTLEQFRIFKAVVEAGGVNAAAKQIHKTQPAISNAIRRLEEELAVKLFTREGYRLDLSTDGAALFSQVDRILQNIETLETTAKHLATGNEPELKISMEVLTPLRFISQFLAQLGEQFPSTCFSLSSDVMRGAMEKLIDAEVDLVLGPKLVVQPDIISLFLATIDCVPVAAPGFIQTVEGKALSKADMSHYSRIVIPENTKQTQAIKLMAANGSREIMAADFAMKKHLILEGLGWGYMPVHLVDSALAEQRLLQLNISDMQPQKIDIHAFRTSHRPMGPVLSRLWHLFEEAEFDSAL